MSAMYRFFSLLEHYPQLAGLWSVTAKSFDIEAADRLAGKLSTGESVVLNCLRTIWAGRAEESHRIDFSDLAALDDMTRRPLIQWLADPFFP